jgi:catechol 2,3-dioxygenase-like lactoylglutathione lyase family enzyme
MEGLVAQLLAKFEEGKITRRKLAETLAIAAATLYGGSKVSASAAAPSPAVAGGRGTLRTLLVNHISYGCPDYRPARDFYAEVMGMELVPQTPNANNSGRPVTQATLTIGPRGKTPPGSPPGTPAPFIIVRNGRGTQEPGGGIRGGDAMPPPPVKALINHIAYTIADWDQKKVLEILKKRGLRGRNMTEPREDTVNSYHVMDPHGFDVQISGIKMTAFGGGS